MPEVKIEDKGCRGCTLCVDVCPVDVFSYEESKQLALVDHQEDCIGCYSCFYICPSQCVQLSDVEIQLPFHRIEQNMGLVEKFLQTKSASQELTDEELEIALKDVGARLLALAGAVTETMGRAQKAVGRKAGDVAAAHLPEIYEETELDGVLKRMQERFKSSFDFDYTLDGENVDLTFKPCGLHGVVTGANETLGEAVLCKLFHEYWAGLLSKFTGAKYACEVPQVGEHCVMKLGPRQR